MSFRDVIGQEKVTEILQDSIRSERVGHAYLFCGADGIGKYTVAEAFARALLCTDAAADSPCGRCEACLLAKGGTNPDLVVIDVPGDKASIGVGAVRAMQEDLITAPLYSRKKVCIIRHSEKMTAEAQNALLKTLEEPPAYVVLLLLCSNISLMLDTVRSRVQRLDLSRYTDEEIRRALESRQLDPGEDSVVFSYADGIIGRAISYFTDTEIHRIRADLMDLMEKLPKGSAADRLKGAKTLSGLKEKKEFVFFTLMSLYRDTALYARYGRAVSLQNRQQRAFIEAAAAEIDFRKAEECLSVIDRTWKRLKQNVNYDLAVGNMLIKMQEVLNG